MQATPENNKYVITYITDGNILKYQTILSIYTFCHHVDITTGGYLFVIYTDTDVRLFKKYLRGLPVAYEILSKARFQEFRGPRQFIFRAKPKSIEECLAKYKSTTLYLDGDTVFLRNPQQLLESITPGHTIMNREEYNFVDGGVEYLHWFKLRQVLKHHAYVVQGEEVTIPLATMMWNAGVIGISYADAGLITDVITLTDALYEKDNVFIAEQFATSYILQKFTKLQSSGDYIEHYWPKATKNTFNTRIPVFLKESVGLEGSQLYKAAFEFAMKARTIATPYSESVLSRINKRIQVIVKAARYGQL